MRIMVTPKGKKKIISLKTPQTQKRPPHLPKYVYRDGEATQHQNQNPNPSSRRFSKIDIAHFTIWRQLLSLLILPQNFSNTMWTCVTRGKQQSHNHGQMPAVNTEVYSSGDTRSSWDIQAPCVTQIKLSLTLCPLTLIQTSDQVVTLVWKWDIVLV